MTSHVEHHIKIPHVQTLYCAFPACDSSFVVFSAYYSEPDAMDPHNSLAPNFVAAFDTKNFQEIWRTPQCVDFIWAFGITNDFLHLACGCQDNRIRLYDRHSVSSKIWKLSPLEFTCNGPVGGCDISGDGKIVASYTWSGKLTLWSTEDGKIRGTSEEPRTIGMPRCRISPDGRLMTVSTSVYLTKDLTKIDLAKSAAHVISDNSATRIAELAVLSADSKQMLIPTLFSLDIIDVSDSVHCGNIIAKIKVPQPQFFANLTGLAYHSATRTFAFATSQEIGIFRLRQSIPLGTCLHWVSILLFIAGEITVKQEDITSFKITGSWWITFPATNKKYLPTKLVAAGNHACIIDTPATAPSFSELEPLLLAWLKCKDSPLHCSKLPLEILQVIIEYAWECELPSPLHLGSRT